MALIYLWCRFASLTAVSTCVLIIVWQLGVHTTFDPFDLFRALMSKNATITSVQVLPSYQGVSQGNVRFPHSIGKAHTPRIETVKLDRSITDYSFKATTEKGTVDALTENTHLAEVRTSDRTRSYISQVTLGVNTLNQQVKSMEWLGNEGKTYSDYGDKGCRSHTARPIFKLLMERWISMTKELKITYFLTCGTLLGSYRNSDLIPNDGDLDVLVDVKDYPKLKRRAEKRNFNEDEKKFHLVLQEDFLKPLDDRRRFSCLGKHVKHYMDHCSFQEPLGRLIREGFHLDIYHFISKGDIVEDPSEGGRILKQEDVFPLRRCLFMGLETRCPNNPKAILINLYGDLRPKKVCKKGNWVDRE